MPPKFPDTESWQQAEILMQPVLIRLVDNLRKQLEESPWQATYQEVETPYPGHQLCLRYQDQETIVNLWDLCYEICFRNYQRDLATEQIVEIDTTLLDEIGEVDWNRLDEKARSCVEHLLASPTSLQAPQDV